MSRVFLEKVEDVVNALNEGKTVFGCLYNPKEDVYGEPSTYVKMKDGTILADNSNGFLTWNAELYFSKNQKYWYEFNNPLSLEVGKMYEDDKGVVYVVVGVDKYHSKYSAVLLNKTAGKIITHKFNSDGTNVKRKNIKLVKEFNDVW